MKKKKTLKKTLNPYMITFGAVLGASSLGLGIYYGVYEKYYYEPKTILDQIHNLQNDANLNYYFSDELNQLQQDYENIKKTKSNEPIFDGLQQQINRLVLKQQLIKKDENNITLNNNEKTYLGNYINKEYEEVLKYVDKNNPESYYRYLEKHYKDKIDDFIKQAQTSKGKSKHNFRNLLIQYYHTEKGVLERIKDTKQKIQTEIDAIKDLLQNVNDTSKRKQKILLNLNTNILDKIKQQKILAQQLKDQVDLYNKNLNQIIDVNVNNTQLEYWSTQLSYYEGINQKINLLNHHKFSVSDFKQLSFQTIKKSTILNDVNHKFYDEVIKNNYDKNESIKYFLAYEYQIKNDDLGIVSKVFKKLIPLEYDGNNNNIYLEFKQTHPKFYANYKNKFDIKEQYFYVENDAFLKESFVRKEVVKLRDYYEKQRDLSIESFINLVKQIHLTNFKKINGYNLQTFNSLNNTNNVFNISEIKKEDFIFDPNNPSQPFTKNESDIFYQVNQYLHYLKENQFKKRTENDHWYNDWEDSRFDDNLKIINDLQQYYQQWIEILYNAQYYQNKYNNQKSQLDRNNLNLNNNTFKQSVLGFIRTSTLNISDAPYILDTKFLNTNVINSLVLSSNQLENGTYYQELLNFVKEYDKFISLYKSMNTLKNITLNTSNVFDTKNTEDKNKLITPNQLVFLKPLLFLVEETKNGVKNTVFDETKRILNYYNQGIINYQTINNNYLQVNQFNENLKVGLENFQTNLVNLLNDSSTTYNKVKNKTDQIKSFYDFMKKGLFINIQSIDFDNMIKNFKSHLSLINDNQVKLTKNQSKLNDETIAWLNPQNTSNNPNQKLIKLYKQKQEFLKNLVLNQTYENQSQLNQNINELNHLVNSIDTTITNLNTLKTLNNRSFDMISLDINQKVANQEDEYSKEYLLSLDDQQLFDLVKVNSNNQNTFNTQTLNYKLNVNNQVINWSFKGKETTKENNTIYKSYDLQTNDFSFFNTPIEFFINKKQQVKFKEFWDSSKFNTIMQGFANMKKIFNENKYYNLRISESDNRDLEYLYYKYLNLILNDSNNTRRLSETIKGLNNDKVFALENFVNNELFLRGNNKILNLRNFTSSDFHNLVFNIKNILNDVDINSIKSKRIDVEVNTIENGYEENTQTTQTINKLVFATKNQINHFVNGIDKLFVEPFRRHSWLEYWDEDFLLKQFNSVFLREYETKFLNKLDNDIRDVVFSNSYDNDEKERLLLYLILNQQFKVPEVVFGSYEKIKTFINTNNLLKNQNVNDINYNDSLFRINENTLRNKWIDKRTTRYFGETRIENKNGMLYWYKQNISYHNVVDRNDGSYGAKLINNLEFDFTMGNTTQQRSQLKTINIQNLFNKYMNKLNELDTQLSLYSLLLQTQDFNKDNNIFFKVKNDTLSYATRSSNTSDYEYYTLNTSNSNRYGFRYMFNFNIPSIQNQSQYDALFNVPHIYNGDKIASIRNVNINYYLKTNGQFNPYHYFYNDLIRSFRNQIQAMIDDPKNLLTYWYEKSVIQRSDVPNYHYYTRRNKTNILSYHESGAIDETGKKNQLIKYLENDDIVRQNEKIYAYNPYIYGFQMIKNKSNNTWNYYIRHLNYRISDVLMGMDKLVDIFNSSYDNDIDANRFQNAVINKSPNHYGTWEDDWNNFLFTTQISGEFGHDARFIRKDLVVPIYIRDNKKLKTGLYHHLLGDANHIKSKYYKYFRFITTNNPND